MIRVRWFVTKKTLTGGLTGPYLLRTTIEPVLPQLHDAVTLAGVVRVVTNRHLHEDVQKKRPVGRPAPLPEWHVVIGMRGEP